MKKFTSTLDGPGGSISPKALMANTGQMSNQEQAYARSARQAKATQRNTGQMSNQEQRWAKQTKVKRPLK